MSDNSAPSIFQLKVTLRDLAPPIWRSIQVLPGTRLSRLHQILQIAFSWENYHLHDFISGGNIYSVPGPDDALDNRTVINERYVPLERVINRVGDQFEYRYDFGDDWRHDIVLEAILPASPKLSYPRCIDGAKKAPPEDVGGPPGFLDYLEAISSPKHPGHAMMLMWRGPFKPDAFSISSVNAALNRQFHPRTPTQNRRAKLPAAGPAATGVIHLVPNSATPQSAKTFPLKITSRERELIVNHSFTPPELLHQLQPEATPGKPALAHYTLEALDELAGYIAAEANHATNRKLEKEWDTLYGKIDAILQRHSRTPK